MRASRAALAATFALALAAPVRAADVTVKLDPADGFVLKDHTGSVERLRIGTDHGFKDIHSRCARFAADHHDSVRAADIEDPPIRQPFNRVLQATPFQIASPFRVNVQAANFERPFAPWCQSKKLLFKCLRILFYLRQRADDGLPAIKITVRRR